MLNVINLARVAVLTVSLLMLCAPCPARATGTEPATDPQADPAPCAAATVVYDSDRIIAACGALIDNPKTSKPDRLKVLVARGGVYQDRDMVDSAISDYDSALRLDPTPPAIFNR